MEEKRNITPEEYTDKDIYAVARLAYINFTDQMVRDEVTKETKSLSKILSDETFRGIIYNQVLKGGDPPESEPVNFTKGRVNMFNNFKHRFGEKGKRAAALLVAAALLCSLTGCGKSETGSSAPLSSSSVPQSVPANKSDVSQSSEINSGNNSVISTSQSTPTEESKAPQSSEVNSDNTSSSGSQGGQSNGQSDFDFDEAVKNITLFGHKISLPCAWSDFSEDFSHDDMYIPSGDDMMCGLLYKGKEIGNIFFSNCADAEDTDEVESNLVVCIVIGFTNYGYPYNDYDLEYLESAGYYTGQLELGLGNILMSSTENDIIAEFGEPSKITEVGSRWRYLDYKYDNGYFHFVIDVNKMPNRIMELYINVYSN